MVVLDSTRALKRFTKQTFVIKSGNTEVVRHTLLINPEEMTMSEPAKVTVTETLGGGYITDFGSAFKTVSITGITGYRARQNADGETRDGYTEFVHLRNEVYRKFLDTTDTKYEMYWYNWEDEEYYRIQPTSFRLMRNKNEPILYRYEMQFTCIETLGKGGTKPKLASDELGLDFVITAQSLATGLSSMSEVMSRF